MSTLEDLDRQTEPLVECNAWHALERHAVTLTGTHLRRLLDEPVRFDILSRRFESFVLDLTRNRLTAETLGLLLKLARERNVEPWIAALFAGERVNNTEDRPALHMALRSPGSRPLPVDGVDVMPEVLAERERMLTLAEAVRGGSFRGATGKRFRHIVNIGIGGSDLGPVMAVEALRDFADPELGIHFVSNVDGTQLTDVLRHAAAEETLFIICSKSFTTEETQANADAAREWLSRSLGDAAVARHFVAVSVNGPAMDRFGIAPTHRFRLWDWVGGRYSLWSAIGLAVAIAIGADNFRQLLAGAHAMDEHFRTTRLSDNLPALLALVAIWNQNFEGVTSHAILPYDGRLHRFPAYLQQLEMESNGKSVTRHGQPVSIGTETIIWGELGNNAQHSFFQLLHQGTSRFSADFIAPVEGSGDFPDQHLQGLANMLAQAEAFARGHSAEAVEAALRVDGRTPADIARLTPHKLHPGNHPGNVLIFSRLDPWHLGALIALYEHNVFVQAIVWGINPFDQWGVELGKQMARGLLAGLRDPAAAELPPIAREIRSRRRS